MKCYFERLFSKRCSCYVGYVNIKNNRESGLFLNAKIYLFTPIDPADITWYVKKANRESIVGNLSFRACQTDV